MLKTGLFTKYIISYTALFFIPVLILAFNAFNVFNDVLNKEINLHNSRLLEQSRNAIDARVEEMNKLALQVSNNPYFSTSRLDQNFLDTVAAINMLQNFSMPNNFYSNFFIYYFDKNMIYSPFGTYTPYYFSKSIFVYENWDLEQMKKYLLKNGTIYVRPAEKVSISNSSVEKYITYVVPIPYASMQPTGAMFYIIKESTIYNMLKETLESNKSNVLLLDGEFQPISMLGSLSLEHIDLQQLSQSGNSFAETITIDQKTYFMSSITSNSTGWTYVSFIPTDTVTSKLSKLKTTTMTLFISLFIFGVILIFILMRINYKPLNELTHFATRLMGNEPQSRAGSIESVRTAVDHMSKQIFVLEKKVQTASAVMRNRLLLQLLKGYFTDQEEFNIKGAEYGLSVTGNEFVVVILMFDSLKQVNGSQVEAAIESTLAKSYHIFLLENVQDDQIILILSDENNSVDNCGELCASLQQHLNQDYQIHCTIGIGKWHSSLSDISESYLQASSAIGYWQIRGKNTIIPYPEMEASQRYMAYYPHQQIELLERYISERDVANYSLVLDHIMKSIQEKNIPLMTARLLFYNMIQAIVRAIYKNNYTISEEIETNLDIVSLVRYETVEQLSNQIKAICTDLISTVGNTEKLANKQIEKIKEYISLHYHDSSFSLQSVSDHLDMSVSYLSHYFKAQVNRNISDYVNDLRMTKAKSQLIETDMNLQEIAQSVGYMNLSSFIRKFKQTTGITPGAFRELNKNNRSGFN